MATVKATFLLPVKDKDGRDLLPGIDAVRRQLWTCFSAYTSEGRVGGSYQMMDGSQATDINEKFSLVLDDSRIGELEQVLREFKAKTIQEALYLEIQHGVELRFL